MGTATLMTVEQFAHMQTADTEHYELVEGELIPLSSGTPLHAKVRSRMERRLEAFLEQSPIGDVFAEIDCRLTGTTVRRPDIAVFLGERAKFDLTVIPVPYAPDIAIEVLSPSEKAVDVNRKALDYLAGGTQEVWLLDHENAEIFVQTTSGMSLFRGEDPLETKLLPGFSVSVNDLLR